MPRKKKTIVEETLPDTPETPGVNTEDFADAICIRTKVYKLNSGSRSFCFETQEPVDEVSVQAQYPTGGKFIVLEYNSLNQIINTTHIDIEPKPIAHVPGNGVADFQLRVLMDELNFTRQMMLKMIEGKTDGNNGRPDTSLGELAQAMQMLHQLSPQTNASDLILKGMELGMKANGGADWKASLVDAAKDIAPAVVQVIGAAKQNPPIPQGQTMIESTPASLVKSGIDWLKPKILSGMEPGLAVSWVIQNSNDALCQQLIAQAVRGDVSNFAEFDPEINNEPFKSWFVNAIQQLKEWYAEQSAATGDSIGGTGDDTDGAVDAVLSSPKPIVAKVG